MWAVGSQPADKGVDNNSFIMCLLHCNLSISDLYNFKGGFETTHFWRNTPDPVLQRVECEGMLNIIWLYKMDFESNLFIRR
jgi:hypothetical protein